MSKRQPSRLTRRERQIMDAVYAHGQMTAAQVLAAMPDAPSYSAVRTLLRILEEKGHLRHRRDGTRYVYAPTRPRQQAGRHELLRVLQTFFEGSLSSAVAMMLDKDAANISDEQLRQIEQSIERARRKGDAR